MERSTLVAIGALVVVVVVVGGVLVFALQPSSTSGTTHPPEAFASEPFPALWQTNVTGTPYSALVGNGTIFVLTYGNTTSAPPPFGPDYPWNVIAIGASTGTLIWSHRILVGNQGNSYPQLVETRGIVYFVQAGSTLALDSVNESLESALYALGFNPQNGRMVSLAEAPTPAAFFYGTYDLVGSTAYLAWPEGTAGAITVESVVLLGTTAARTLWIRSFTSGESNAFLSTFYADSQYIVVPLESLYVLNAQTGEFLYNSSIASSETFYPINGALVGGDFYFAWEWGEHVTPETVQLDLLGLDLADQTIAVNTTVTTLTEFSSPLEVRAVSGSLVVPWVMPPPQGSGPFSVFTDNGTLLWSSAGRSVSFGSGGSPVSLGVPWATLAPGVWLLASLSIPSGSGEVATQYFESVDQSNGTVLWTAAFPFPCASNSTMLYPPNAEGAPSVVPLTTSASLLVYRWGGAVGYADL